MKNIIVTVSEHNDILSMYHFNHIHKAEQCFVDMVKHHDGGESYLDDMGSYLDDGYFASTNGITICISHPMEYKTKHDKEEITV